jgi:hypothetical protein
MNYVSLDKLSTIVSKKAVNKYDFYSKPTIVYSVNSDDVTGHVGIIIRKSGIKKLYIQDVIDFMTRKP